MRATLAFIVGPTACGKTELAVELCERTQTELCERKQTELCERTQTEIINSDSVQFYAGVEIGAAKPSPEQLARARHHLIGHVPLGEPYNAGDFRRDALAVIEAGERRGVHRFAVVGGSGFYVQALERGMYEVPSVSPETRQELLRDLEANGIEWLHAELACRDPVASAKIHPRDQYRVLRALEILRSSHSGTLTEIRERFAQGPGAERPLNAVKIGLYRPREVLRKRVEERTRKMLASGLIDEVERLRSLGLGDWWPMRSVGYKETQDFLDGRLSRDELAPVIVTSTMQLAKRQMTWFKRDPEITWFDAEGGLALAVEGGMRLLAESKR